MRSAGNFHPEWGYLAPAPSFMRTVRVILVATAIGATAGAAVVVSLVGRPSNSANTSSIAAHALVTSVQPAAPAAHKISPVIAQTPTQPAMTSSALPASAALPSSASSKEASALPLSPSAAAPSVEHTPPLPEVAPLPIHEAIAEPDAQAPKKLAPRKRHTSRYEPVRHAQPYADPRASWERSRGFGPLLGLFTSRTGSSHYPN